MCKLPCTLGLMVVALTAQIAAAQAATRVSVAPTSKLWIEGTSNVHDWKCDATTFDAAIEIDALAAQLATAPPKMLKKVAVKIPVKSLKCGHNKMNDNLYKALDADKNAEISYVLATFEAVNGTTKDDFTLKTTGALTIAGVQKSVTMDILATRLADGMYKAIGTVPVKMTDFGVKPPKVMLGAIKTGDEVKVKFEFTVGPKVVVAAIDR